MNIDIKQWKEFVKDQEERRQKVSDRMALWNKENPYVYTNALYGGYELHNIYRDVEESKLKKEFGVIGITFENFLTHLANS